MTRMAGVSLREKYSGQNPPAWELGEQPQPQPIAMDEPKRKRGRPRKVIDGNGS